MVELRVGCAAEELRGSSEEFLTQCLSCSQGIRATSWDTEEKLWQLIWHDEAQLLGIPMRHEGEEGQEQCLCRQASGEQMQCLCRQASPGSTGEPLPSLSDTNPSNDPGGIWLQQSLM